MKKAPYLLGQLTDEDIEWLSHNGTKKHVLAGTVLIREGEPIESLYILLDGTLTVSVEALGDREVTRSDTGEIVGEMSFVDTRPPSATVTVIELIASK